MHPAELNEPAARTRAAAEVHLFAAILDDRFEIGSAARRAARESITENVLFFDAIAVGHHVHIIRAPALDC